MSGFLMSHLFALWARLLGRADGGLRPDEEPAPPQAEAPAPVPEPAPAPEPVSHAAREKALEQSYRETVGSAAAREPRQSPPVASAEVRAGTLRALEGLRQIPALQSLVQGVTRIMCRDGVCLDEVAEALQKDSSLCVRVLTMANSAAVAPEQRIEDLQTALQMLGMARVRRVAQAVFTLRDAQRMTDGLDWRHLWIHALATAAIAEELERRIRPASSQHIYMAALLHDVGKIVLSTVAADAYRDVIVASWNGEGRLEDLERAALGVDHREAGVVFARGNRLSDAVVEAIAHHDDPTRAESHRFEAALVSAANFISKSRGLGFSGARLEAADGDLENLPAWSVLAEEAGSGVDPARIEQEMSGFFATLRDDLRGMRESAA
jgi:putative nucleotidyltransferase with HDIG domain